MRDIRVVIGTPADARLTNAQCINGREIGSRLPSRFRLTYFHWGDPDPRLTTRGNVRFVRFGTHGNAARVVREVPCAQDVYFNINCGPAESIIRPLLRLGAGPATLFQVETRLPVPAWLEAPRRHLRGMSAWIRQATLVTGVSSSIVRFLASEAGRKDAVRVPVGIDAAAFPLGFPLDE